MWWWNFVYLICILKKIVHSYVGNTGLSHAVHSKIKNHMQYIVKRGSETAIISESIITNVESWNIVKATNSDCGTFPICSEHTRNNLIPKYDVLIRNTYFKIGSFL